ncbi:MAG: DUF1156 domain-containing protein [Eggerthellaceae bacterium]|nr:DUF1156 domain-containing protein [Eggerthellaceae bacterium]
MGVKKLIEVALPLDAINNAAAREKTIRHGHPSTLHIWWARRPLAAARAVIWASLVDDPSSHPEKFPTEKEQNKERKRLFRILSELVIWENSNNKRVLVEAKAEIKKSLGEDPSALKFLDPFAGGGAIPLEAQRLGLDTYAQDLNPVAVIINKAMIEIPPIFAGHPAVNPESQKNKGLQSWEGNAGLAVDVEYYGNWMKEEAFKRIGHLYPKVEIPEEQGGGEATVIVWIWARTVKCPNPACGHDAILVRSFDLSKKKGHEWHVVPECHSGNITFEVMPGKSPIEGTVSRSGASCIHCGSPIDFNYIRAEGQNERLDTTLIAIVAEGERGRLYIAPSPSQEKVANIQKPENFPNASMAEKALGFRTQNYGLTEFSDLFTNRQMTMLTTLSDLVQEAQEKAKKDAAAAGMSENKVGLSDCGSGARAYGEAIGVYLAFLGY